MREPQREQTKKNKKMCFEQQNKGGLMKAGIFRNKIAQGTIEYIFACMLAIGAASICITVLKPIFVDCMIVDSCGVANAGGNVEELALFAGTDEYLNFDGLWDAPEWDFPEDEEAEEKKPSVWDDVKNDFSRKDAKNSKVLDAICEDASCSVIKFRVQTPTMLYYGDPIVQEILNNPMDPNYHAVLTAVENARQMASEDYGDYNPYMNIGPYGSNGLNGMPLGTFNIDYVLRVTQTPPEMHSIADALSTTSFNENGKNYWVLETTTDKSGLYETTKQGFWDVETPVSTWETSDTLYVRGENGKLQKISAEEASRIQRDNDRAQRMNDQALRDAGYDPYLTNANDPYGQNPYANDPEYNSIRRNFEKITPIYQKSTNEFLGTKYEVTTVDSRLTPSDIMNGFYW